MSHVDIPLNGGGCRIEQNKITIRTGTIDAWCKIEVDRTNQEIIIEEKTFNISRAPVRVIDFPEVQRVDGALYEPMDPKGGISQSVDLVTHNHETIHLASVIDTKTGFAIARAIREIIGLREPGEPSTAERYNQQGIKYAKVGNYDKAIAIFTEAIDTYPFIANFYYNRAMAFEELGRIKEAIADYQTFIEIGDNPRLIKDAKDSLKELHG